VIDLHVHSLFSDGGIEPTKIMNNVKNNDLVILTDHNNCYAAQKYGYIPGIEIEVKYHRKRVHMLLYDFDIKKINKYEKKIQRHDIKQFIKNCSKLGIRPTKKFLKNNCYFNKIRINNLLVEMNLANDGKDAFYKYTNNLPDLTRKAISLKEVFQLEKITGGVLSLAHPYKYYINIKDIKKLILFFKNRYNLRAVECYSNHGSEDDIHDLVTFCNKHNLLISGGSDYHAKYGIEELKAIGYVHNYKLTNNDLTILSILRKE